MKNRYMWIGILLTIIFTCSFFLVYYFVNYEDIIKSEKKDYVMANTTNNNGYYDAVISGNNGTYQVLEDDIYKIVDDKDKVLETLNSEVNNLIGYYDGYYSYEVGGFTYIKRNGLAIKEYKTNSSDYKNTYEIIKDPNDEKSLYLFYSLNKTLKAGNYAYINLSNYGGNNTPTTVVFDTQLGIIKNTILGSIINISYPFNSFFIINDKDNNNYTFVKKDTGVVVKEYFNSPIIGDKAKFDLDERIVLNNNKYLVISQGDKVGLINSNFEEVIPFIYEDIVFKTNNVEIISAKKNGKYGIIDISNKEIVSFKYDYLEVINDYIIGILNNELFVLNKSGEMLASGIAEIIYEEISFRDDKSFEIDFVDNKVYLNILATNKLYLIDDNKVKLITEIPSKEYIKLTYYYKYYVEDNKIFIVDVYGKLFNTIEGLEIKAIDKNSYCVKKDLGYRYIELGI